MSSYDRAEVPYDRVVETRPPPAADEAAAPPRNRTASIVTIAVFVALLLAPAALALAGRAGADTEFIYYTEMRHAFVAPPPTSGALATGGWERDLERQIADAFPLRRAMIESYDEAKYRWFDDIAGPHVVRGREGWLFFNDEERRYDDGTFAPSDADLARIAARYRDRAQWCARRGIAYVVVLVPNKSSVYARYLPAWAKHVEPNAGQRLVTVLRAQGVLVVDPRAELADASFKQQVYKPGDTHWNDAGAYIAYRQIVEALRSAGVRDEIPPHTMVPETIEVVGDLDRLAGIAGSYRSTDLVYRFPERAHQVAPPAYAADPLAAGFQRYAYEVGNPRLGRAVLFGDSFTVALRRFVAQDFRRTVVLQHEIASPVQFDRAAVAAERPNVVIQELIERSLVYADRVTE